jgi:hypothetical protein
MESAALSCRLSNPLPYAQRRSKELEVYLLLNRIGKDLLWFLPGLKPSYHNIYLAFLLPHFLLKGVGSEYCCLVLLHHAPKRACPNDPLCPEEVVIHSWTGCIWLNRLHPCASKEKAVSGGCCCLPSCSEPWRVDSASGVCAHCANTSLDRRDHV